MILMGDLFLIANLFPIAILFVLTFLELGVAIQTNIRLNHVSLVRNPRGGNICSIRDSITQNNNEIIDLYIALCKLDKYITI